MAGWLRLAIALAQLALAVGCGQGLAGATASPMPPTATPTAVPLMASSTPVIPASTRTQPPTTTPSLPTMAPTPQLERITLDYSGALSVEDLNTLLLDLRALAGVYDAQGGAEQLQVTYDPQQVTRQAIVDAIQSHGYQVKNQED